MCEMKTPASFCGDRPARAIWVCVPSPQSKSHHSPSPTTASALTLRRSVGLPELVPSGMIFILPAQHPLAGIIPPVQDDLVVGVEMKAFVSLNVQIAEEGLVP